MAQTITCDVEGHGLPADLLLTVLENGNTTGYCWIHYMEAIMVMVDAVRADEAQATTEETEEQRREREEREAEERRVQEGETTEQAAERQRREAEQADREPGAPRPDLDPTNPVETGESTPRPGEPVITSSELPAGRRARAAARG